MAPFARFYAEDGVVIIDGSILHWDAPDWSLPLLFIAGVLLLFGLLHVARGIGRLHGQLAKHLLVRVTDTPATQ